MRQKASRIQKVGDYWVAVVGGVIEVYPMWGLDIPDYTFTCEGVREVLKHIELEVKVDELVVKVDAAQVALDDAKEELAAAERAREDLDYDANGEEITNVSREGAQIGCTYVDIATIRSLARRLGINGKEKRKQ